jgi:hypothetical protein
MCPPPSTADRRPQEADMELLDHTAVITGAQRIWSVGAEAGASKWMALRREVPGLQGFARLRQPIGRLRQTGTDSQPKVGNGGRL